MGFIYKLTFPSEKSYIGQTIRDIHERLKEHQYASSGCVAISRAIQKYGWENVKKEWYEVPDEDLNFYEEMLVALLGTLAPGGYNLKEGGGATGKMSEETKQKMKEAKSGEKHPMYGKEHTEESKQKMREANSGEKHPMFGKEHTEETKKKQSDALSGEKHPMYGKTGEKHPMYGKSLSDEHKQKMSEAKSGEKNPMFGKSLSDEHKQKLSEALSGEKHPMYGKEHTEESKKKMSEAMTGEKNTLSKKVYQYTLDGTYVDDFASSGEAARALGKTDGTLISKCARGKSKGAYGFKWSRGKL